MIGEYQLDDYCCLIDNPRYSKKQNIIAEHYYLEATYYSHCEFDRDTETLWEDQFNLVCLVKISDHERAEFGFAAADKYVGVVADAASARFQLLSEAAADQWRADWIEA